MLKLLSRPCIVFFFLLVSCSKLGKDKTKTTTVSGQVRTYGTEEAVRGAPVSVMLWHEVDVSNQGFLMIDSVRTNEQGHYTLTDDLEEGEPYFLSVAGYSHKLYLEMPWLTSSFTRRAQVAPGGSHTINLEPVAYGYVNFHFKSLNPKSGNEYTYNLGAGAYETFYDYVDTYRLWDFGGNLSHRIYLNFYNGKIDTNWQKEFIPPAFDTLQLEIEF